MYVSATEVEISGSEYEEKKTNFDKTTFKDMYCKISYIFFKNENQYLKTQYLIKSLTTTI